MIKQPTQKNVEAILESVEHSIQVVSTGAVNAVTATGEALQQVRQTLLSEKSHLDSQLKVGYDLSHGIKAQAATEAKEATKEQPDASADTSRRNTL